MKYFINFLFLFVVTFSSAQNGLNLTDQLPNDPNVNKGVLENGMTYYVRSNGTPENRADFYLMVNAGSIDEDDDQKGLAHFTEHMAFNGTKNFPKNELVNYLESIGMEFGPEVNAYTSFNHTVYMIKVPLDKDEYIENGLQVLYDWASQITDSDEEIEKERGVIHEEWRLGQGADERMMQKWLPVLLKGSRYAERLPIGDINIIDNAPPATIRRFRDDWYRPDLEAVIVVGDFDKDEMTQRVIDKFSQIPTAVNPRKKQTYDIPDYKETLVSVATDKEAQYPIVELYYKHPMQISKTVADYREGIKHNLFNTMINDRLNDLAQSATPPFIAAGSGYSSQLYGPKSVYYSTAYCQNGRIEDGFKAILEENERVKRFGFTETELERAKKSLLSSVEKSYNERDKQESDSYADEYTRNFSMSKEPFPGIEKEYSYYETFLPDITLDEVNALANEWIVDENRVIVLTAPEIEGVSVPTEDELLAVMDKVENEDMEPYEDVVSDQPLLNKEEITPGKVVSEKQIDDVGAVEWTLSNGATVVVKPTDFKDDEILFSSYSLGGNSLYGQNMEVSADLAPTVISMSGIGNFDNITLQKLLSGKVFSISPYISDLTEGFTGSSSVKDVESMLQMVYLYFTNIRVDPQAFSSVMQRYSAQLENRQASPDAAFSDTLTVVSTNYSPRKRPLTLETLKEANFDDINEIAHERFKNASDFKFFFVGSINLEEFKPLVEEYIGSIPSSNNKEMWKDLHIEAPEGVVVKKVYKGQEPRSINYTVFHGDFDYNTPNLITLDALSKTVDIRLLEVIREEMSSVYTIGASPSADKIPEPKYSISIYYGTDPDKVDELNDSIFSEIEDIAEYGPSEENLQKAQEQLHREHEVNLRENSYWLSKLRNGFMYKNGDFSDFSEYDETVNQLSIEKIKEAAENYFDFNDYYSVTLMQEK